MPFRTKRVGAGWGYDCARRSAEKVCCLFYSAAAASEVAPPRFLLVSTCFSVAFRSSFFRLPAANHRLVGAYYGLVAANDGLVGANENNIRPTPAQMPPFALKISIERR